MRRSSLLLGLVLSFAVVASVALATQSDTTSLVAEPAPGENLILAQSSDTVVDRDEDPTVFCTSEGGPGWGGVVALTEGTLTQDPSATTPQACCEACVANPDCSQWTSSAGVCRLNLPPGNDCSGVLSTSNSASGQIRCPSAG